MTDIDRFPVGRRMSGKVKSSYIVTATVNVYTEVKADSEEDAAERARREEHGRYSGRNYTVTKVEKL